MSTFSSEIEPASANSRNQQERVESEMEKLA